MAVSLNTTRRGVMGGVAASLAAFVSGARAATMPADEDIERMTEQLAKAMKARHGGKWRWKVIDDMHITIIRDFEA